MKNKYNEVILIYTDHKNEKLKLPLRICFLQSPLKYFITTLPTIYVCKPYIQNTLIYIFKTLNIIYDHLIFLIITEKYY